MMRVGKVWKAIAAAVGTVSAAAIAAFADDVVSIDEAAGFAAALVVGAGGVWATWRVRNTPPDA